MGMNTDRERFDASPDTDHGSFDTLSLSSDKEVDAGTQYEDISETPNPLASMDKAIALIEHCSLENFNCTSAFASAICSLQEALKRQHEFHSSPKVDARIKNIADAALGLVTVCCASKSTHSDVVQKARLLSQYNRTTFLSKLLTCLKVLTVTAIVAALAASVFSLVVLSGGIFAFKFFALHALFIWPADKVIATGVAAGVTFCFSTLWALKPNRVNAGIGNVVSAVDIIGRKKQADDSAGVKQAAY